MIVNRHFKTRLEITEYDENEYPVGSKTYFEYSEVESIIEDLENKIRILEDKYKTLSDNYKELLQQKISMNEGYWKKKCIELMNTIKSIEENLWFIVGGVEERRKLPNAGWDTVYGLFICVKNAEKGLRLKLWRLKNERLEIRLELIWQMFWYYWK